MEQINIQKETDTFLLNLFKKLKGKYIYYKSKYFDEDKYAVWLVEDVEVRKNGTKVKLGIFNLEDKKICSCGWSLIRNLKSEWNVLTEKELNKMIWKGEIK